MSGAKRREDPWRSCQFLSSIQKMESFGKGSKVPVLREAQIVGTWERCSEEVDTERGNGRKWERETLLLSLIPPSIFYRSLPLGRLSPLPPLSLRLFPLFFSPIHPISDAS